MTEHTKNALDSLLEYPDGSQHGVGDRIFTDGTWWTIKLFDPPDAIIAGNTHGLTARFDRHRWPGAKIITPHTTP